jgi:hypothetical protein
MHQIHGIPSIAGTLPRRLAAALWGGTAAATCPAPGQRHLDLFNYLAKKSF